MTVLQGFEKVDAGKLSATAHFKNDLGLDSLDTVEVVMAVEEEFNIEIPDAEAEKIQSTEGHTLSVAHRSVACETALTRCQGVGCRVGCGCP